MTEEQPSYFSNVGDMIRHIRRQKNITIIELAAKMGVSQAYLSKIELGETKPTQEQIEVIQFFIRE